MLNQVFTPEQLETIQLNVLALMCYAKKHDANTPPHWFRHCERIVGNIDISRDGGYAESSELTELIKSDWRSACHFRAGLPEYYIPNDEPEIRKSVNIAFHKQVASIEEYINAQ